MGRRGPAKKPTKLKLLTGNPGKRKLNLNEPMPTVSRPAKPEWIPDAVGAAWDQVADRCEEMGVLTVADGTALEVIAITRELYRSAVRELMRDGQTCRSVDEDSGAEILRRHPAVGTAGQWATLLNSLMGKFGLTPADRVKLVVEKGEESDPFEAFLRGNKGKKRQA